MARAGAARCAIDIAHVVEILRPLPISAVQGAPPFVLGVALLRGVPTPVINARSLIGAEPSPPRRFVSLRVGDHGALLSVDEVEGVVNLTPSALGVLPPLLRHGPDDILAALGALDDALLFVLRTARLVPASTV